WASVGWGLVGGAPIGGDRGQPGQSQPQTGQPGQGTFGSGAPDDEVAGESTLVTGRAPGPLRVCGGRVGAVRRPRQPMPVHPGAGEVRHNQVDTTPPRRRTSAAVSTRCIAAVKCERRRGTSAPASPVVAPYRAASTAIFASARVATIPASTSPE